jgi:hypothetical protein
MGTITSILGSGADAFSNLWDVTFDVPGTSTILKSAPSASIRVNNFDPPDADIRTYTKSYKGVTITVPGSSVTLKREISFTFRIDANYALYKELIAWRDFTFSPEGQGNINFGNTMTTSPATDGGKEGTITVKSYAPASSLALSTIADNVETNIGAYWVFKKCVCVEVSSPAYTRGADGAPVSVTARFLYGTVTHNAGINATTTTVSATAGLYKGQT